MLFSTLRRGASTSWPQPVHRRRMSIPTRSTSHRRLPQELEARLEPSPWPDYPLYLPNPKPLCLLAIPAAQLKEGSHG